MSDVFSGGIMPQVIQNRQGLQNLEAQRAQMDAMQRQQQMQDEAMKYSQQYIESVNAGKPDSNLLYQATLKSPEMAKNVLASIGIVDAQQKQRLASDIASGNAAIRSRNKPEAMKWLAKRIASINAAGGDPKDTRELAQMIMDGNWDAVDQSMAVVSAALVNDGALKPELAGYSQKDQQITPYQQAQLDLRSREVAAAEKRAGRPDTQITIDNKQNTEIEKLAAKDYQDIVARASAANKEIATIGTLENLSEKAFSGSGAGALLSGAKILNQFGISTEGLTESEIYEKLSNTLVLDKSQQMSGALSNADMTFLQNTVPMLTTSKEGRRKTFEISRKLAEREKQVARLATQYRRENGGKFDSGEFQIYLDEWKEQNPLFEGAGSSVKTQAPQQAIDYLRQNPQLADQFKAKYGYLPELN